MAERNRKPPCPPLLHLCTPPELEGAGRGPELPQDLRVLGGLEPFGAVVQVRLSMGDIGRSASIGGTWGRMAPPQPRGASRAGPCRELHTFPVIHRFPQIPGETPGPATSPGHRRAAPALPEGSRRPQAGRPPSVGAGRWGVSIRPWAQTGARGTPPTRGPNPSFPRPSFSLALADAILQRPRAPGHLLGSAKPRPHRCSPALCPWHNPPSS